MTEQQADGPAPGEIPFGLLWGIKRSFVAYVRRMPDGQGSIHDGAVPLGENTILFPATEATSTDGDTFAFRGDVRFRGHGGMLFVRVAEPVITVRGDRAELSIADPYARVDADRVPLVTLQLAEGPAPEGARVWLGSDVRLTEAGAVLFNDVYQPGEEFEQLSVILPLAD
ncbi:HtaA domain-containing protein [Blastococcus sp. URHD0036]|uniref:HtaA domain-containing protein n=1 Tax=Blastococcus sp. URHD0036 TaxID=1380356 RepID=UPI0004985A21|nr:HtaA domain-containing protein [Blastococcus sp. URHD0036]